MVKLRIECDGVFGGQKTVEITDTKASGGVLTDMSDILRSALHAMGFHPDSVSRLFGEDDDIEVNVNG